MMRRAISTTRIFSGIKKESKIPSEKERTPTLTTFKKPRLHIKSTPTERAIDRLFFQYMKGVLISCLIFSDRSEGR